MTRGLWPTRLIVVKAKLHSRWAVTPDEARRIQLSLRDRVERRDRLAGLKRVAGADVALDMARGKAIAGGVVYRFPGL